MREIQIETALITCHGQQDFKGMNSTSSPKPEFCQKSLVIQACGWDREK